MQINLIGPTRIIRIYICLVLMVAQPWALSSQVVKPGQSDVKVTGNGDIDLAEEAFANGDYVTALKNYLSLLKKEPKSEKLNYRVGVCYLNSPFNKSKALPYFLTASKAEKVEPDLWFYLGRAYHLTNKFDEALDCFNKFKKLGRGSSENKKLVDPYIQYVYNAKELMKFPLNVTFSNLGPNVNSNYPDYQAFVPEDESFLVFTSRRKDGGAPMMPNGQYPESVYISKVVTHTLKHFGCFHVVAV